MAAQLSILPRIPSFAIQYGSLRHYLPHPGVCLVIEPQEQLDFLRVSLESAAVFEGAKKRKHKFSAHMTIAEFITAEQTNELMAKLNESSPLGEFICDSVSYVVPDATFRFTERVLFKLA